MIIVYILLSVIAIFWLTITIAVGIASKEENDDEI